MSSTVSMRGGRGGAASRGGRGGRGQKRARSSKYSDSKNSNSALFLEPHQTTQQALIKWKQTRSTNEAPSDEVFGVITEVEAEKSVEEVMGEEQKSIDALVPMEADTQTLNGCPSLSTTQCSRLDLFFGLVRGCTSERIHHLLPKSWYESPEHTLGLLFHSRDARDGKGERLISLYGMIWLRQNKPATYLLNLVTFIGLGYMKDLLQLAVLVKQFGLEPLGSVIREDKVRQQERRNQSKKAKLDSKTSLSNSPAPVEYEVLELELLAEFLKHDEEKLKAHQHKVAAIKAEFEAERASKQRAKSSSTSSSSKPMEEEKKDETADIEEGEWLNISDEKSEGTTPAPTAATSPDSDWIPVDSKPTLNSRGHPIRGPRIPHLQLSLAAKWAPTEGSSFDKKQGFAKRLARLLYPNNPQCFRLYREFLSQARTHLAVTEKLLCTKQYDLIDFEKIPAKCHQLVKKALGTHCATRYQEYLGRLRRGEAKINTGGLMPHELASDYIKGTITTVDETIEGAWGTLLAKLKQSCCAKGGLKNAISIVDVSGSMTCNGGIPMNVGISLGLIVSELSTGPFKGRCITFSERPQWFNIPQHTTLLNQVRSMQGMQWGMSTNLMSVFDMILDTAVANNVKSADLPSTIFIFSDMQFNQACDGDSFMGGTAYQMIKARYLRNGFEVPQIVFWNLNGGNHTDVPIDITTPGVALIGGYSAQLLKAFLEGQDINPMKIMLETIKNYHGVIEESERTPMAQ